MRFEILCAAACAAMLAILPAQAADTAQQSAMKSCAATWKTKAAADKAKTKYSDYMSGCMKAPTKATGAAPSMMMTAKPTASPMAMQAAGGKAKCKDGVVVTYKSRSGTCSGHKGVATWM
jgi:glucose/arabinose dehydrogenase